MSVSPAPSLTGFGRAAAVPYSLFHEILYGFDNVDTVLYETKMREGDTFAYQLSGESARGLWAQIDQQNQNITV